MISHPILFLTFRWMITRVFVLFFLLWFLAPHVIDFHMIGERLKVRRLNDQRPNFNALVQYSQGIGEVDPQEWRLYQDYFKLVLKYLPKDPITQSVLGTLDLQSGKKEQGVDLLQKASRTSPILFWPDYNLGVYFYNKGQYKLALDHLDKAVQIPINMPLQIMMDSIIYRQIFASPTLTTSIVTRLADAYQDAFVLLLACLDKTGADQILLALSSRALSANAYSDMGAIYYYAGLGAFKTKQMDQAIFLFQKNIEINPTYPWGYFWISKIFELAGDVEKSKEYSKAFVILNSQQDQSFTYDQKIRLKLF